MSRTPDSSSSPIALYFARASTAERHARDQVRTAISLKSRRGSFGAFSRGNIPATQQQTPSPPPPPPPQGGPASATPNAASRRRSSNLQPQQFSHLNSPNNRRASSPAVVPHQRRRRSTIIGATKSKYTGLSVELKSHLHSHIQRLTQHWRRLRCLVRMSYFQRWRNAVLLGPRCVPEPSQLVAIHRKVSVLSSLGNVWRECVLRNAFLRWDTGRHVPWAKLSALFESCLWKGLRHVARLACRRAWAAWVRGHCRFNMHSRLTGGLTNNRAILLLSCNRRAFVRMFGLFVRWRLARFFAQWRAACRETIRQMHAAQVHSLVAFGAERFNRRMRVPLLRWIFASWSAFAARQPSFQRKCARALDRLVGLHLARCRRMSFLWWRVQTTRFQSAAASDETARWIRILRSLQSQQVALHAKRHCKLRVRHFFARWRRVRTNFTVMRHLICQSQHAHLLALRGAWETWVRSCSQSAMLAAEREKFEELSLETRRRASAVLARIRPLSLASQFMPSLSLPRVFEAWERHVRSRHLLRRKHDEVVRMIVMRRKRWMFSVWRTVVAKARYAKWKVRRLTVLTSVFFLRQAFHQWRTVTSIMQRFVVVLGQILTRANIGLRRKAWSQLRLNSVEVAHSEDRLQAGERTICRCMSNVLCAARRWAWVRLRGNVRQLKRREVLVRRLVASNRWQQLVNQAFWRWARHIDHERIERIERKHWLTKCFSNWCLYVSRQASRRSRLWGITQRLAAKQKIVCFARWKHKSNELEVCARQSVVIRRLFGKTSRMLLAGAFNRWFPLVSHHRRRQRALLHILGRSAQVSVMRAWSMWRTVVGHRRRTNAHVKQSSLEAEVRLLRENLKTCEADLAKHRRLLEQKEHEHRRIEQRFAKSKGTHLSELDEAKQRIVHLEAALSSAAAATVPQEASQQEGGGGNVGTPQWPGSGDAVVASGSGEKETPVSVQEKDDEEEKNAELEAHAAMPLDDSFQTSTMVVNGAQSSPNGVTSDFAGSPTSRGVPLSATRHKYRGHKMEEDSTFEANNPSTWQYDGAEPESAQKNQHRKMRRQNGKLMRKLSKLERKCQDLELQHLEVLAESSLKQESLAGVFSPDQLSFTSWESEMETMKAERALWQRTLSAISPSASSSRRSSPFGGEKNI